MTLVSTVGGAGGPLYGTLFLQLGVATAGKTEITAEDWSAALSGAVSGVQTRGKAAPGDKTMLDALIPARDAFAAAIDEGAELPEALRRSADAAEQGMKDDDPPRRPEGPGELSRRTQRRAPRPRRHVDLSAVAHRRRRMERRRRTNVRRPQHG